MFLSSFVLWALIAFSWMKNVLWRLREWNAISWINSRNKVLSCFKFPLNLPLETESILCIPMRKNIYNFKTKGKVMTFIWFCSILVLQCINFAFNKWNNKIYLIDLMLFKFWILMGCLFVFDLYFRIFEKSAVYLDFKYRMVK